MRKKILITSALPYANGPLHFGHIAGAYLPGDCYARFQRLLQHDVLYICGSDEYGVAITLSAEMAGRTPKEHVDIYHEVIKDFFSKLNMSFDHYSRTTNSYHQEVVQKFFLDLLENGFIEEKVSDQLYSEQDKRFLADRYVMGTCPKCGYDKARGDECTSCGASYETTDLINPVSKLTGSPLSKRPTKHWYLLLDKFKDRLLKWIEVKHWKGNVENFAKGFINELHPRAITRDTDWGVPIPLPGTEGKVLYVWFDAPIGYISATVEWAHVKGNPDLWKKYWCDDDTKLVHFIGKDNIPFHAAIFPAMTMGQNEPFKLVDDLPANEFYKLEGRQFSKSDGWYIDLDDFFKKYPSDCIRYAIASNAPETSDSEFTWKDFQLRCNSDLLGKFGNLVNRVLVFAKNQCDSKIAYNCTFEEVDREFFENLKKQVSEIKDSFENYKLRKASHGLMDLAQMGNVYFDLKKPWKDAKEESTRSRMLTTIYCCLECLKLLALTASPIIPDTAKKLWQMLGFDQTIESVGWEGVLSLPFTEGQTLKQPVILFSKIEDAQIEAEVEKLKKMSATTASSTLIAPLKDEITFEEFEKLDLRVGEILQAEAMPKSKKLLKLLVDIGTDQRTIVSGISQYYQPEELKGRKVLVVANLKPAKLMGQESKGMILAGSLDQSLKLISTDELKPGCVVS